MKLEYIGQKADGERAFERETGIVWMPGSVHDVPDAFVAEHLAHPTIWKRAAGEAGPVPPAAPKPYPRMGLVEESDVDDEMDRQDKARAAEKAAAAPLTQTADVAAGAPDGSLIPVGDLLDRMSDETVRALAKSHGLKVPGIALTKGAKLRAKVSAALAAKG